MAARTCCWVRGIVLPIKENWREVPVCHTVGCQSKIEKDIPGLTYSTAVHQQVGCKWASKTFQSLRRRQCPQTGCQDALNEDGEKPGSKAPKIHHAVSCSWTNQGLWSINFNSRLSSYLLDPKLSVLHINMSKGTAQPGHSTARAQHSQENKLLTEYPVKFEWSISSKQWVTRSMFQILHKLLH